MPKHETDLHLKEITVKHIYEVTVKQDFVYETLRVSAGKGRHQIQEHEKKGPKNVAYCKQDIVLRLTYICVLQYWH